jgi:hypothetical protein
MRSDIGRRALSARRAMATNVLQHAKIDPEFSLGYNLHTAMTRYGKSPWSLPKNG